jgi:hypothetical protein
MSVLTKITYNKLLIIMVTFEHFGEDVLGHVGYDHASELKETLKVNKFSQ